jgi:hypothetical protein
LGKTKGLVISLYLEPDIKDPPLIETNAEITLLFALGDNN